MMIQKNETVLLNRSSIDFFKETKDIIEDTSSKEKRCFIENRLINQYVEKDHPKGTLINKFIYDKEKNTEKEKNFLTKQKTKKIQ